MMNKEDWENALKQYKALLVNALVNIEAYKFMAEMCEKKIKEFPDDDPMPSDLKEVIKEVKE